MGVCQPRNQDTDYLSLQTNTACLWCGLYLRSIYLFFKLDSSHHTFYRNILATRNTRSVVNTTMTVESKRSPEGVWGGGGGAEYPHLEVCQSRLVGVSVLTVRREFIKCKACFIVLQKYVHFIILLVFVYKYVNRL